MPIDRDYLFADKSVYSIEDGSIERLQKELRKVNDPQTKAYWVDYIKAWDKVSETKATQTFNTLVLDSFLLFLRIYRSQPIYVNSTTPVWFHDKMPVIVLESSNL